MTALVVSTYNAVERTRSTVQSVISGARMACVVVDVDGNYRPVADEPVLAFMDAVREVGAVEVARAAAGTLEGEGFTFFAEVIGAEVLCSRGSEQVVVLAPGVVVYGDLGPFAAAAEGGVAVLPRAELASLGRLVDLSGRLKAMATQHLPMTDVAGEPQPLFTRSMYALDRAADLRMLREIAGDWRTAVTALDQFATASGARVVRQDAQLISAWRGVGDLRVARDEAGVLRLGDRAVVAVDMSRVDPAKPWVMDAEAPILPTLELSQHPDLLELVTSSVEQWAEEGEEGEDRSQLPPRLQFDEILLGEARRAHVQGGYFPNLLDPDEQESVAAWGVEMVPRAHRRPVARYLAGIRSRREDLREAYPEVPGTDSPALARWALNWGVKEADALGCDVDLLRASAEATLEAQPAKARKGPRDPGVNLIGYLAGEMGLGESGRLMDAALHAAGVPTSTFDVGRGLLSRQTAAYRVSEPHLYDTSLICVNGSETATAIRRLGDVAQRTRRIGMWYWELEDFPIEHQAGFKHVHEVWAATDFMRDAIAAHSPGVPVRTVMPPLPQRAADPGPLPARYGIDPARPWFLFTFDYLSIAGRKNPYGLVEAFIRAFPEDDGTGPQLVIKSINGEKRPYEYERLRIQVAGRRDVIVIDEYLPNDERHMLVAHCTAYVSLHKAEGLGLTLAEAMAWGKPVIATRYGGVMQFMNDDNGLLVGWKPGSVPERMGPYEKGLRWAEPDLDEAAALMRLVVEHPERARAVGERAAEDIRTLHSIESAGARIAAVLEQGRAEHRAKRAADRARKEAAAQAAPRPAAPARPMARRVASRIKRQLKR